ncbi:hypothetical protein G647_06507 [Cladophialophora carrionii CBS 160.54]|uniref:AB hydrolase-1 domain-containing protein n=1 Tax=Cladophialophora carrionii CBS 160.54 TaxID=1279043 RepID=V9D8Z0_9EURO|nr:uncharacterized protein G647_06507 [Cladophialophora carrionii CBS 160.54]ETI22432.1 hypothetical protein G647_06507 [Cladophialophora carrionii CBS 160.54]
MVQDPASNVDKPVFVIVPGSFSPAPFYADVVDALRSHGYEAIVETLPSSARSPRRGEKAATMQDDTDLFRDIVEKLADQGKDVVIVTHSYGGIPGTECSKGLSKEERKAAGKAGGISRFVYVTSVVPTPGNSLKDLMGELVPSFINIEGEFMSHVTEESAKLTFSDLPFEEAKVWAERMSYHSASSFEGKLTYPGYNKIPVSYIFCEKDVILPPEFQRSVIAGIERESGKKVDVLRLSAAHCPNITAPQELAAIVVKAIATAG